MEIIKERKESHWLLGLTYLAERGALSQESRLELLNQQKGLEGERRFDSLILQQLKGDALILNDLLLTYAGKTCQIDTLIVTGDKMILYEVKNYKGNFTLNRGQLQTVSGRTLNNPAVQLSRTATLIQRMLEDGDISVTLEKYVVFVHPTFHLYHSNASDPFIFPTQIEAHFSRLSQKMGPLNETGYYLISKLLEAERKEAAYQNTLPAYTFSDCLKGLSCLRCSSLKLDKSQRRVTCRRCGHQASMSETIYFNIEQYRFLFPERRINTRNIAEWINIDVQNKRLRRILNAGYDRQCRTKRAHYTVKTG